MKPLFRAAVPAAILALGIVSPAQAYLDPGTGSILLQGLIAGVVGGLVTIKLYWSKLKTFFGGKADKKSPLGDDGQ